MIINSVTEITSSPIFLNLKNFIKDTRVFLKLEGLNIAHSVKLKTARYLLRAVENQIIPGKTKIIESSSGNLAIALSIICKELGVEFICVTDPNIAEYSEELIKVYGGKIIKVTERDEHGGFLNTRIRTIYKLLDSSKDYIWTNQYANHANYLAHYSETAAEIYSEFKALDYLFIGAGTTGTLVGCGKFFKEYSPNTKIIAVDAEGSVTFGYPAKKRHIPGIGTSRKPEIANESYIDDILLVSEIDTIRTCHKVLKERGLFIGGSTGSVLAAIIQYSNRIKPHSSIVAISPDFGDKYIPTVYNDNWVIERFGNIFENIGGINGAQ